MGPPLQPEKRLIAAWRRRPAGTALATVLATGLTLWWVGALVRRYDARAD